METVSIILFLMSSVWIVSCGDWQCLEKQYLFERAACVFWLYSSTNPALTQLWSCWCILWLSSFYVISHDPWWRRSKTTRITAIARVVVMGQLNCVLFKDWRPDWTVPVARHACARLENIVSRPFLSPHEEWGVFFENICCCSGYRIPPTRTEKQKRAREKYVSYQKKAKKNMTKYLALVIFCLVLFNKESKCPKRQWLVGMQMFICFGMAFFRPKLELRVAFGTFCVLNFFQLIT